VDRVVISAGLVSFVTGDANESTWVWVSRVRAIGRSMELRRQQKRFDVNAASLFIPPTHSEQIHQGNHSFMYVFADQPLTHLSTAVAR
jgi:hypothetical protein